MNDERDDDQDSVQDGLMALGSGQLDQDAVI